MIKNIFITIILSAILLNACKNKSKQDNLQEPPVKNVNTDFDSVINLTTTNKNNEKLEMSFKNNSGIVLLQIKGDTIALKQEKAASGFWYKNPDYELRGKGNDFQLKKHGEVIFEHQDDIVLIEAKNDNDKLHMTFNNTEKIVKVYLNDGAEIVLVEEKAASGIWYKNDHYELSGKGNSYTLSKDGDIIFKN